MKHRFGMGFQRGLILRMGRLAGLRLGCLLLLLALGACGGDTGPGKSVPIKNIEQIKGIWASRVDDCDAKKFNGLASSSPDVSVVIFGDGGVLLDYNDALTVNSYMTQGNAKIACAIEGDALRIRQGKTCLMELAYLKDGTLLMQSAAAPWANLAGTGRSFSRLSRKVPELKTRLENSYVLEGGMLRYNGAMTQEQAVDKVTGYYPDSGTPFYAGPWRRDQMHGWARIYYRSGMLKEEGRWDRGAREGKFKFYTPDGRLQREGEFAGGRESGLFTVYYRCGRIRERITYRDGMPEGAYKSYWINGRPRFSGIYHKMALSNFSTIEREGTMYYENGVRHYEGEFHNGLFHGQGTFFNEKGQRVYEGKWIQGERAG